MIAEKVWTVLCDPTFWGYVSLLLTVAAYTCYLYDTFKRGARPNILTWGAFGVFTAVGWRVQVERGAGPGGWAMEVTWASCFIISAASIWKQHQEKKKWWRFPRGDLKWVVSAFLVFGIYLAIYVFLRQYLAVAAIVATVADIVSYEPTIKQGVRNPYQDSVRAFALNCVKFIPTLVALLILRAFSLATAFYPIAILVMNAYVVWLLKHHRGLLENARSTRIEKADAIQNSRPT